MNPFIHVFTQVTGITCSQTELMFYLFCSLVVLAGLQSTEKCEKLQKSSSPLKGECLS